MFSTHFFAIVKKCLPPSNGSAQEAGKLKVGGIILNRLKVFFSLAPMPILVRTQNVVLMHANFMHFARKLGAHATISPKICLQFAELSLVAVTRTVTKFPATPTGESGYGAAITLGIR
jgi:hypothetical protein